MLEFISSQEDEAAEAPSVPPPKRLKAGETCLNCLMIYSLLVISNY